MDTRGALAVHSVTTSITHTYNPRMEGEKVSRDAQREWLQKLQPTLHSIGSAAKTTLAHTGMDLVRTQTLTCLLRSYCMPHRIKVTLGSSEWAA